MNDFDTISRIKSFPRTLQSLFHLLSKWNTKMLLQENDTLFSDAKFLYTHSMIKTPGYKPRYNANKYIYTNNYHVVCSSLQSIIRVWEQYRKILSYTILLSTLDEFLLTQLIGIYPTFKEGSN